MQQTLNRQKQHEGQKVDQESNKNNDEKSKQNSHHKQHNHDELDSDCQGCRQEKRQNQKLVDFYQRLDKMSTKVKKIKNPKKIIELNQQNQQKKEKEKEAMLNQINSIKEVVTQEDLQNKLKQLDQKLNISQLPSITQIRDYSSKQIGFQLAAALIQRQMKYKNQNKKLQAKIDELLQQKKNKQQKQYLFISNKSKITDQIPQVAPHSFSQFQQNKKTDSKVNQIKDSLDFFKQGNKNNSRKLQKDDDASYWDMGSSSINSFKNPETTFFQTKKKPNQKAKFNIINQRQNQLQSELGNTISKKSSLYNTEKGYGLNLWLYQFKSDEYQDKMINSWLSQKNTNQHSQTNQKYNVLDKIKNNPHNTQKVNKSARQASINKTSIIQKNILNDLSPLPNSPKKKRY